MDLQKTVPTQFLPGQSGEAIVVVGKDPPTLFGADEVEVRGSVGQEAWGDGPIRILIQLDSLKYVSAQKNQGQDRTGDASRPDNEDQRQRLADIDGLACVYTDPVANAVKPTPYFFVEALGLPGGAGGAFVSGATMANATALAAARDATLSRVGWDAHREGLVGAQAGAEMPCR